MTDLVPSAVEVEVLHNFAAVADEGDEDRTDRNAILQVGTGDSRGGQADGGTELRANLASHRQRDVGVDCAALSEGARDLLDEWAACGWLHGSEA